MEHYDEEKQNEVEALESIYGEDFIGNDDNPFSFKIRVETDSELGTEEVALLRVEYTEQYPDAPPIFDIEFEGTTRFTMSDIKDLKAKLDELITDYLGMAMVYNMAYGLKESMTELMNFKEAETTRLENERIEQEIAIEQKKFIGTPVTVESFEAWKMRFEEEMAALQKVTKLEIKKSDSKKIKLNGRELFEQDRSLANSDNMFFEEGDISVDPEQFKE